MASQPQLFSVTLRELNEDGKRTGRELNAVLSRDEMTDANVMDAVTGSMFEAVNTPGVPKEKMILFGKEGGRLVGPLTVEPGMTNVPWHNYPDPRGPLASRPSCVIN